MTPNEALIRLIEGNARFVNSSFLNPRRDKKRREETFNEQNPFAVILTCSDSRIAPAILFDQGIGDLYVVRDGGNVIDETEQESVEFAISELGSLVILVMGHENCGVITSVLNGNTARIPTIAKLIKPSLDQALKLHSKNPLSDAIKLNAIYQKNILMQSPLLQKRVEDGKLIVHAAFFNLDDGLVELLD